MYPASTCLLAIFKPVQIHSKLTTTDLLKMQGKIRRKPMKPMVGLVSGELKKKIKIVEPSLIPGMPWVATGHWRRLVAPVAVEYEVLDLGK